MDPVEPRSVGSEDAPPARQRPPADPDLLARWIGVAQLLASAGEMQTRGGGAWPGLALVTADTANEAILGMIAASGPRPPTERDHFDQVYSLAFAVLRDSGHPMPASLSNRVLQVHRLRNLAVHLGAAPPTRMVETALRTATELRGLAIDALDVLEAFRDSGPVRAVAEIVALEAVSIPLAEAERLLSSGDLEGAANQASIALDGALSRVTPALRSWRSSRIRTGRDWARDLKEAVEALTDRSNRMEAWIVAAGVGLTPGELDRLQRLVGSPVYTLGGPQPHSINRDPKVELTAGAVEWAVLSTADVIYRLWQNDSMRLGEAWEE